MNTNEKIIQLRKYLDKDISFSNGNSSSEREIKELISKINNDFVKEYAIQRKYLPRLITVYEETAEHVISLLLHLFMNEINELKNLQTKPIDLSLWDDEADFDTASKKFNKFLEENKTKFDGLRLSDSINLNIEENEAWQLLSWSHNIISHLSLLPNLKGEDANSILLILWATRNIAVAVNRKEIFYFILSTYLDSLLVNENFQFARDLAEECLTCSYQDQVPEYGYYISYKVFGNLASSVTALHYGIIAIRLFKSKEVILDYVLKNLYWESIKFLRNINVVVLAIDLYENRPTNVEYSEYEINKFSNVYFSCLLFLNDANLPLLTLSHIEKVREYIIRNGEREALPWLAMLLNIKKNYSTSFYDSEALERYILLFKQIVHTDNYNKLFGSLFGNISETISGLKKSLVNLTFTRSEIDFATDNKLAIMKSQINILQCFQDENIEGYLLSMIIQSDFTIVFKEKISKQFVPVKENYLEKEFDNEYYAPEYLINFIQGIDGIEILWLGTDNSLLLPLYFQDSKFKFLKDKIRHLSIVKEYTHNELENLPLDTYKNKSTGSFKEINDYEKEENKIIIDVDFFNFEIKCTNQLLVIKDIELSPFPHNLLTANGAFISNEIPVSNIMSLEWYIENSGTKLSAVPSIQIWIPTESQDFAICLIHSKLEDHFLNYKIDEINSLIPEIPLNSEINIIVAHGNSEISTFPSFYVSNQEYKISIRNFDHIIGSGKILLLFVCHAGSEKSDVFRNQTLTIIKQFLQNGYKAVIAPFWALHVDVPPIWLPEFLDNLQLGKNIGESVNLANRKVSTVFKTPKAYSCLHLYGDPLICKI